MRAAWFLVFVVMLACAPAATAGTRAVAGSGISAGCRQRLGVLRRARAMVAEIRDQRRTDAPRIRVVASRYYDTYKERYVEVDGISIQELKLLGGGTGAGVGNPDGYHTIKAALPNAKVGKYYRVKVFWNDGSTWCWDYQVRSSVGLRIDVSRPL